MATQNCIMILEYLKHHYGVECERRDIASELHIPTIAVIGVTTPLVKKGYATKREETVRDEETGKNIKNTYYTLTEEGLTYDPTKD